MTVTVSVCMEPAFLNNSLYKSEYLINVLGADTNSWMDRWKPPHKVFFLSCQK